MASTYAVPGLFNLLAEIIVLNHLAVKSFILSSVGCPRKDNILILKESF